MKLFRNAGITVAACAFLLIGCNNERSTTTLTYNATQCADAWSHGSDDAEHIINIDQYLTTNGINALNVELDHVNDSVVVCLACQCPSGIVVSIEVDNADVPAANALGFN